MPLPASRDVLAQILSGAGDKFQSAQERSGPPTLDQAKAIALSAGPGAIRSVVRGRGTAQSALAKSLAARPFSIRTDNPGGEWLAAEQAEARATGRLGSLTGWLKGHEPVNIDPKELQNIPGTMGEHIEGRSNFRGAGKKAELIRESLRSGENIREPIFITVDSQGNPFVSEGNNRLAVAIQEGLEEIPVEIRWFSGGEAAEGLLSPANLERLAK